MFVPKGQIIEGYIIIATNKCETDLGGYRCFAEIYEEEAIKELKQFKNIINDFYREYYNISNPLCYENGRAGGLIHKLISKNQKVVILTFFTEYDKNLTSHYLHSSHNDNMYSFIKLYSKRANEDIAFCNKLSAIPIHGKILDCIYRTD
ncbi:hypothetical protein [Photorhabdus antumapuensis]|uniref:hypothetical protein n=1 Tax=Photorhabdus antumapuensis TaxID=2862867 RepID=UPI001CED6126|nr:hypothetical protein [Photorhabdus antumapuensis]